MKQNYQRKINFLLRLSGWLCLVPAYTNFFFWRNESGSMASLFLAALVITILFAAYVLATSKSDRWTKAKNLRNLAIFSFVFISVVISIPIFIAYRNCRRMHDES